jgi:hypothetical protein
MVMVVLPHITHREISGLLFLLLRQPCPKHAATMSRINSMGDGKGHIINDTAATRVNGPSHAAGTVSLAFLFFSFFPL